MNGTMITAISDQLTGNWADILSLMRWTSISFENQADILEEKFYGAVSKWARNWSLAFRNLKFMFSKKATKIDEIFTLDLTFTIKRQRLLVSKDGSEFWSSQTWQHFLTQTKHFEGELLWVNWFKNESFWHRFTCRKDLRR